MDKKVILTGIILVVIAGALLVFNLGSKKSQQPFSTTSQAPSKVSSVEAGQPVPDFELADFNGNKVKLSQFLGKPVFLDFWAAWCPFCINEMLEIEKVHEQLGDKLVVLGIHRTATESKETGAQFAQGRGVTYTLLQDPTDQVYKSFTKGGNFMPVAAYIDKEGKLVSIKYGPKTADEINSTVASLVK